MRPTPEFNTKKAAQVSALFAQNQGGTIDVLKLVKLLYLADREFIKRYDEPILFDHPHSMNHGPVNSISYDLINGVEDDKHWNEYLDDRAGHKIGVRCAVDPMNLDQLSRAELKVLDDIWAQFGHMTKWEIRDYTHKECPEWEDPDGSSYSIPYRRIFAALGKADPNGLENRLEERKRVSRIMANL